MVKENGEIVFWTLRQKFIDSSTTLPEQHRQVMYYSLAIGHHVGIIDCLRVALRCPLVEYRKWAQQLADEQAQRKMLGVLTFGEIIIDASHLSLLRHALAPLADDTSSAQQAFSKDMLSLLDDIAHEPAIYLLARQIA